METLVSSQPSTTPTVNQAIHLSDTSKNNEIAEFFKTNQDFIAGNAVVASASTTSNPLVIRVMIVQLRNDLQRSASAGNIAQAILASAMNWEGNERIVRTWQNFNVDVYTKLQISVGENFNGVLVRLNNLKPISGFNADRSIYIKVVESFIPETWKDPVSGQPVSQKPVINPQSSAPLYATNPATSQLATFYSANMFDFEEVDGTRSDQLLVTS